MASPLERLDAIRDQLINQGIGSSGLTRQAIQRANLPQLGQALATSQATRASAERNRLNNFINNVNKINRPDISGRATSASGAGNGPAVEIFQQGDGAFVLRQAGGKSTQSKKFNNLDELQSFLRQNPEIRNNLFTVGQDFGQSDLTNDPTGFPINSRLKRILGVQSVSPAAERQLLQLPELSLEPTSSIRQRSTRISPEEQARKTGAQGQVRRNIFGLGL